MNLAQIIEALPLQVYVRRGELVIHFSSPADLLNRLAETAAALAELDGPKTDARVDRVSRRATGRPVALGSGRSENEPAFASDPDQSPSAG